MAAGLCDWNDDLRFFGDEDEDGVGDGASKENVDRALWETGLNCFFIFPLRLTLGFTCCLLG